MNDYDDSEDYSSSNSFRARSNTWPLNRPDLMVPNGVCIDETLPEIDLEEDDLFTTNENWSTTGLVDHDIMSWDPILNAQPHLATNHPQLTTNNTNTSTNNDSSSSSSGTTTTSNAPYIRQPPASSSSSSTTSLTHHEQLQQQPHQHPVAVNNRSQQTHQQQPPTIHHHHQQQLPPPPPPPPLLPPPTTHNLHQQPHSETSHQAIHHHQQHHHLQQQHIAPNHHLHHHHHHNNHPHHHHDNLLDNTNLLLGSAQVQHQQQQQQPQHHHHQITSQLHQTLSSSHCLDSDNYHIQQMHQLRLDNPPHSDVQTHYVSPLSSGCIHNSSTTLACETYNISLDQPSHHLQPLLSARYDLEHTNDLDIKPGVHDLLNHHHQHQIHQMSASLDHGSHILSSSLGTSGIGLSSDLENLDYKVVDPSTILPSDQLDDQQTEQQPHPSVSDSDGSGAKLSNSTASSKPKLNTPRRNAWGNMSYADLISQAINSTNDKRLTLSQIYEWMVQHVPYFKDKGDSNSSAGWKNSVRHNLSLHNRFKRLQNEGTGKSSWWTINPEANIGKCARRRAASMEAPKYEKKRGRAKKRAEAIRQGLLSYPSLSSSLNGSTSALEQQIDQQSPDRFGSSQQLNQQTQILTQPQDPQLQPQPQPQIQQPQPQLHHSQPLLHQQHQIQQQHPQQFQHQQEQQLQQQQHQNSDQHQHHHSSLKLSRNNVLDLIPFPIS